jgi:mono/diheme cytochrome c family protein
MRSGPALGLCIIASFLWPAWLNAAAPPAAVDFNRDVKPILTKNCFACHGPDDGQRKAKLRLDRREEALKERKVGAAIVPNKPGDSLLVERITAEDESERMPPKETGNTLTPEQITTLKRWIEQGAPYAEHWAFVKSQRPELPLVRDERWDRNPIDRFILARLEKEGLKPSPEADRFILLRRASLDLRGLPPTLEEIEQFAKDQSPGAYEKMVDRFLKDPAYGERWARLWLDLARYADSAGYGSDPLRPNMWRYRDWVIEAFNRNIPYDGFTMEQIAGDLLPNPTLEQRMATAFHRNTMTNTEGGTDDEEFRVAAVKDRVDTTLLVWMGVTMGCAKCHNHKFDPITQKEYYRFFAFFNQTADNDQPDERPVMAAPTPEISKRVGEIDALIAAVRQRLTQPDARTVASWVAERTPFSSRWVATLGEITKLQKSRPEVPTLPVMQELPPKQHRKTHLLIKSNFLDPGEEVQPGTPAGLFPLPKDAPLDRLGVAQWLVHPDNPLTARVAVNRYWAQLFGKGIVETEEDFGTQGELPTHSELLDWLATEYVRLGWDTKAMLRLIVTSATYRQSSKVTSEALKKDPKNRLLGRAPRYRLEAEMVRDQALAVSGLLSQKVGGPSVYPPQPPGLWQAAFNGQRTWPTSSGEDKHRRGLYTFWRRTIPYPSMTTFDAPSRETCSIKRIRTNTPLQAFVTLNDPVYVEAAQALARRIVKEGGATPEERARFGLKVCLCRPAQPEQVQPLVELYQTELEGFRKDAKAAKAMATEPLGPLPQGMDDADLAAWTVIANVLLNLDGVLTKG